LGDIKMSEKRRIEELSDLQRKILFAFADTMTDDLSYVTDSEHKSYHLHEKIRINLGIDVNIFYLELRNLFLYGYLDLLNENFYFMSKSCSTPVFMNIEDRLNKITNEMLINGDKDKSCISKYGILAINSYLLSLSMATIDQIEKFKKDIENLKVHIEEHKGIINNFNSQILSIMAILVTVFSIIGLNLGTIKYLNDFIIGNIKLYIGTILVTNTSMALTIYCMFYLLNLITNKDMSNFNFKNNLRFWIPIILLIIISIASQVHISV
jgi:hypothetical protein